MSTMDKTMQALKEAGWFDGVSEQVKKDVIKEFEALVDYHSDSTMAGYVKKTKLLYAIGVLGKVKPQSYYRDIYTTIMMPRYREDIQKVVDFVSTHAVWGMLTPERKEKMVEYFSKWYIEADYTADKLISNLQYYMDVDDVIEIFAQFGDFDTRKELYRIYHTPVTPAKFEVGNIVKLKDGKSALVLDKRGMKRQWQYTIRRKGIMSKTTLTEDKILCKVADGQEDAKYKAGMYFLIDGSIRRVQSVMRDYYPVRYKLYNVGKTMTLLKDTPIDSDTVTQCDHCGTYILKSDATTFNGNTYCPECRERRLRTCDVCGTLYDSYTQSSRQRDGEQHLCTACYRDRYRECERCGRPVDRQTGLSYRGIYFCSDRCLHVYKVENLFVRYSTKVEPTFYHTDDDASIWEKAGYGLELEVDNGGDSGAEMLAEIKEIYLKHDGSVSNGIEIITQPASPAYHKYVMPWEKILRIVDKYRYRSHSTTSCGLHIHASRVLFGATQSERERTIGKVMYFFDKYWKSYIIPFTRREEERINRWAKQPNCGILGNDFDDDIERKVSEKQESFYSGHDTRYQAVNLQNKHTVEFRIFRGTTNFRTILACIQFVDHIIMTCKSHTLEELDTMDWNEFFSLSDYPELKRYLTKRQLDK